MAERRFAALAELKKRPTADAPSLGTKPETSVTPPPAVAQMQVTSAVEKGRGRPPGKRSDPDWKPRTILMRTKTHRRVSALLLEQDDGPDLSELIDRLLGEWASKQT